MRLLMSYHLSYILRFARLNSKGNFGEDPIAVWSELAEVRAVRDKRIYSMTDPSVIHPSQFVGHTAQVFAKALHPENFPDAK